MQRESERCCFQFGFKCLQGLTQLQNAREDQEADIACEFCDKDERGTIYSI